MSLTIFANGNLSEEIISLIRSKKHQIVSVLTSKTNYVVIGGVGFLPKCNVEAKNLKVQVVSIPRLKDILGPVAVVETKGNEVKIDYRPDTRLWVDKYGPSKLSFLLGQKSQIDTLVNFLAKRDPLKASHLFLISGPPGTGKTSAARLAALSLGLNPIVFDASSDRKRENIEHELAPILFTENFNAEPVLIMDEIDGMDGNSDKGGLQMLLHMAKRTPICILCVCNDEYKDSIKTLKKHIDKSRQIRWSSPTSREIVARLQTILKMEKREYAFTEVQLEQLAQHFHCDLRKCINFIQFQCNLPAKISTLPSQDTFSAHYFNSIPLILAPHTTSDQIHDIFTHETFLSPIWLQQNYLYQKTLANKKDQVVQMSAIADAAESMSYADKLQHGTYFEEESQRQLSSLALDAPGKMCAPYYTSFISRSLDALTNMSTVRRKTNLAKELREKNPNLHADSFPLLHCFIMGFLQKGEIDAAVAMMIQYKLDKTAWDSIVDYLDDESYSQNIKPVDKTAFTRILNKSFVL